MFAFSRWSNTLSPNKARIFHPGAIAVLFFFGAFICATSTYAQEPAEDGSIRIGPDGKNPPPKYVSIDFNNVDITVLIKFIAELTNRNFIVDQRVRGKVTIISPKKISVNEAYKVFESVLEVHGFATVKAGEVIKIISAPTARSMNIETLLKREAKDPEDKIVTQIVPLQYADPNEIKRLFTPFVSKSSVVQPYEPTNTLIITDVYSNITRLLDILQTIDVPGTGLRITVMPIQHADATKLVRLLQTMFKTPTRRGKKAVNIKELQFVADERTNTLILRASEDDTLRIKELIKMLDKEMPKGNERIRVYYLEYATAEDLAKVLTSLSAPKRKPAAAKGKKEAPVVSEATNITADKATNSLIIMAEPDDYLVLEDIIKKLDIPRAMVYIECLIMEVNINHDFNFGTEFISMGQTSYVGREGGFGGGFSGGGDAPYSNIYGLAAPSNVGGVGTLPAGFALGVFSEAVQIGGVTFPNLAAVADAFKRDKNVNILSTPQLLTTDNEEAKITVGKNVPYLTKSGTTTTSETYNTYEYKDVGITLNITPQINKDRMIRLKVMQEVNKLDEVATTGENRPTTLKRTVETTVIVKDKSTIAIGGLIDDSFSTTEHKTPCMGDIPLLGWLFRAKSKGQEKTNLFVFLTPHVIETPVEAETISKDLKKNMDDLREEHIKLYRGEKVKKPKKLENGKEKPE